ncbi:RDD family protein [Thiorhodococcus mannitoliphagus]|uniref:RDD family protein n=1 Tax=Thiorhodococcus mannitoliphagus TaxID=329406 RepID=A0A6P1DMN7_9GAMM|nr:RDD family protein [Thiorhodococcus mannitoliphagus]NEX19189.1 RDD family protein [Thiorhodococcus mannitoliphagus]
MQPSIDTIRFNETPEGIDLGLRVAGPVPRALALVLDIVIRMALYLILTPLIVLADFGLGLMLLAFFGLEWLYPVVFEVWRGATPGKRAMGLRVVHDDGTPIGLPASMIRNLLRVVDFLPLLYGVGLVAVLLDRDFRRLGDLAAGTLVLRVDGGHQPRGAVVAAPVAPPLGLGLEAQQAILSFAERSQRLSEARRIELAEVLTQASGDRGELAVARVRGWASWLARGRMQESR